MLVLSVPPMTQFITFWSSSVRIHARNPPHTASSYHGSDSFTAFTTHSLPRDKMFPGAQTSSPNLKLMDPFRPAPRHRLSKVTNTQINGSVTKLLRKYWLYFTSLYVRL